MVAFLLARGLLDVVAAEWRGEGDEGEGEMTRTCRDSFWIDSADRTIRGGGGGEKGGEIT